MSQIKLTTILIIFLVIIILDKGLTIINVMQVNKNFPEAMKDDYFKVEANPVAKWFFVQYGLWFGSVLYGIITLITLFLVYFLLSWALSERIALWIIFIIYGMVIANNSYFLLKYSRIIS